MFLGPGTDLDVRSVYQSGQAILDGHYQVSRVPGSPVFEAVSGVLHSLGGAVAVNVGSGLAALSLALAVAVLVAQERPAAARGAAWFGLAILLNPFIWVAGTSMVDFVWALAALAWGLVAQRRRHLSMALLYAISIGIRASGAFLVAALVLGELWWLRTNRGDIHPDGVDPLYLSDNEGNPSDDSAATASDQPETTKSHSPRATLGTERGPQVWLLRSTALAVVLTTLVFLPPFTTLGFGFLKSNVEAASLFSHLGRAAVKSWYFYGPVVVGLMLWTLLRRWPRLRTSWQHQPVFRMAFLAVVAVQLLFIRYPWKLSHLIPAFVFVVMMAALIENWGRAAFTVLLVAQLLLGAVNLNLANPDQPNAATSGHFAPEILTGPLIKDLQCRVRFDRDTYLHPAPDGEGGVGSDLLEIWACVVPWSK